MKIPRIPLVKNFAVLLVAFAILFLPIEAAVYGFSSGDFRSIRRGTPNYDPTAESECSTSGGAANLTVGKDFSLGPYDSSKPETGVKRRVNLLIAISKDYGLTPEQAAGPVGNFMTESGGLHLPPDVNEGGESGPPKFKGGYGWAQWTASRQRTFIQYAVDNQYMSSESAHATDAANYAYLKHEFDDAYKTTIDELRLISGNDAPEQAAISFESTYEKAGEPALKLRKENARQVYEEYLDSGGASSSGNGSDSLCPGATGAAAIVGDYAFPLLIANKGGVENPGMFKNGTADLGGHPYTAYDILTPPGTPVAAFLSGKVVKISEDKCPGRLISIYNQANNLTISYLHLDFNNHVGLNEEVSVGQQIGLVGSSANGCGTPHLHIDAVTGDKRPGCARENCPSENQKRFVSIGPHLYETFQKVPD